MDHADQSESLPTPHERIALLSPAKRALLELKLRERSLHGSAGQIIPSRTNPHSAPLSFAQQRLWFLHQLDPDSPAYNLPMAVRMYGALNVVALQRTLNTIVTRHEALRTTFVVEDGGPVQVMADSRSVELPVIDLSRQPEGTRETALQRILCEHIQRPFDLSRDVMLRGILLRLAEADHVLLLTIHHIASDAWSMGVIRREMTALYEAFSVGKPALLPTLPIQYADFAQWQRQQLQGEVLAGQLSYWKQQLHGSLPALELPTDRPRPQVQTYHGARQPFRLPATLSERLKALSRQEGVTLFMTLLAVFQTLLYRYTAQHDILVGSPIAGRTRTETEALIGFFVNTLVLRTNLHGNPTFRALLGRVREVALGAYAHQDLPFEKLVEELQPERRLSHAPLFQVMFALQNVPTYSLELSGLSLQMLEVENGTAKFDVTLYMYDESVGLRGVLEYNADLFDTATIARMLGHFQTLLEAVVADPDERLADLSLLTGAERHQALREWNNTQADYPRDTCVHQLFETQAELTPDATAVVFGDRQLTYGQLNRRANQLAYYLKRLGVGPDMLVGICVERSLEMVVGLLGILKAGGAYVPLDPTFPRARLAFMVDDTRTPVLLTQPGLVHALSGHGRHVVCLDTDLETIAQESEDNPCSGATATNLVYAIYTSGSTGEPKGVAVSHRAVTRLVMNTNYVQINPADKVAQASNSSFDAATFEIWGALLNGATLVGIPQDVVLSPQAFAAQLQAHEISVLFLTTALFNQLAHDVPRAFVSVRQLLFGGEAVDPRWVKEILQHGPPRHLLHVYGPTESTTFASWHVVEDLPDGTITIPIGHPIANTQLYIVDHYLQPVAVGVPGELLIGGDGLARCYLNRPDLTASQFIPNPYSDKPGERLYRTGDLGRFRPAGGIEFLGRLDHQVKIRGFRIELGEIEVVLSQHPSIREAVVLGWEAESGDKGLVAYYVVDREPAPTREDLRSFLKATLPEFMVPAAFVPLAALPLTPTGKVDRQALSAPEMGRSAPDGVRVASRDALEHQLTTIWEQILGIHPIGVRDNFFALGGHSLLAVQLLAHIEKTLGKSVPLTALFQAPTVEQLADILRREGWSPPWSALVVLQPNGSNPPFFCVHGRNGWAALAKHLGPNQPFYALTPELDGKQTHVRVEDSAAHYLQDVYTLQPEGPYFLGGFSIGGLIAFEMAQQLRQQGHEVALLALFEPTTPGTVKFKRVPTPFRQKVWLHLKVPAALGHKKKLHNILKRVKQGVKAVKEWCKSRILEKTCRLLLAIGMPLPARLRIFLYNNLYERIYPTAARQYKPQAYPGRVILFQGSKAHRVRQPSWKKLAAGGIEIYEVPGDHLMILEEPGIQIVAEHLKACLEKARTPAPRKQTGD